MDEQRSIGIYDVGDTGQKHLRQHAAAEEKYPMEHREITKIPASCRRSIRQQEKEKF